MSDDAALARIVIAFAAVVVSIVFVSVPEETGFKLFTSETDAAVTVPDELATAEKCNNPLFACVFVASAANTVYSM